MLAPTFLLLLLDLTAGPDVIGEWGNLRSERGKAQAARVEDFARSGVERYVTARRLDGDELVRIGDIHDAQNHFEEAMPYYEQALNAFRHERNKEGEAAVLVKIAGLRERQGRPAEALAALQAVTPLLESGHTPALLGRVSLMLGRVAETLGQADVAEAALRRAVEIYCRLHDLYGVIDSQIRLAGLLVQRGRLEEGLALLEAARDQAGSGEDPVQHIRALLALGEAHERLGHAQQAIAPLEAGLRLSKEERDLHLEADLCRRLSTVYAEADRLEDGIGMARRALTLFQTLRDRHGEADTDSLLGTLYQAQGQTGLALRHHERALGYYRAVRDRAREAGSLLNLAAAYEAGGAYRQAASSRAKGLDLLQSLAP
ncbi:MAG: tetratricopeptide repeat protein [Nitrospirales bacterium]